MWVVVALLCHVSGGCLAVSQCGHLLVTELSLHLITFMQIQSEVNQFKFGSSGD